MDAEAEKPFRILRKENYEAIHTAGLTASGSRVVTSVLDTGAVLDLVSAKFIFSGWESMVQVWKTSTITDASKRSVDMKVIIPLIIHMGGLQVRTCFLVCPP